MWLFLHILCICVYGPMNSNAHSLISLTQRGRISISPVCVCECVRMLYGEECEKGTFFGFGFFVASNACAEIHIEDLHWKSSYNRTRETRFSLSVVLNAAAAGTKTVKCFGKRCFGMGFMLCTENTLYDHIAAEQEKEKNRTGEIKGKESEWMRKRDRKQ